MPLLRGIGIGEILTAGVALLFALTPPGMGKSPSVPQGEPEDSTTIDEIIVYGSKSLNQLRLEMNRAEEIVFDRFNSLNSDDEYDIHCYKEAKIGSRIKRRICRANYVRHLTSEAISQTVTGQSNSDRTENSAQRQAVA